MPLFQFMIFCVSAANSTCFGVKPEVHFGMRPTSGTLKKESEADSNAGRSTRNMAANTMAKFSRIFGRKSSVVIGMIHVQALPGDIAKTFGVY